MNRRSLTEIEVSVIRDVDDAGHSEVCLDGVTVEALANPDDFPTHTPDELTDAARYTAGIVARVGVRAATELTATRRRHGCDVQTPDGFQMSNVCDVTCPNTLLDPNADDRVSPGVWLLIPTREVDDWLDRISTWLRLVLDSEARSLVTDAAEVQA